MFWETAKLLGSVVLLWWGATWLVESSARIAKSLRVSELVIGLTVVALGTSAPEFAVTLQAAVRGHGALSVGNIVGSNIFNIGFILGGVAMVRSLRTEAWIVYRDGLFVVAVTALLGVLLWAFPPLGRWEGGLFLGLLLLYLLFLFGRRRAYEIGQGARWWDPLLVLTGLGLIVLGGRLLVSASVAIARSLGISEWAIGLTVVAAGTSAPEFVTSLVAVLRGRYGISAGNILGSCVFNILGALGLAALFRPLGVGSEALQSLLVLIGLEGLLVVFMRTGWVLSRGEGVALVLLGLATWFFNLL
ncbi:MAG TPA: sodium:calcium antiporter [Deltaproteobacteria bacterium]|nr:sodium:calcium antiporter [Deltaproteobacteria bacterium]